MSAAKTAAKTAEVALAPLIAEHEFGFCQYSGRPLLKVCSDSPSGHVRDQAYMLVASIAEIIGTAVAGGDEGTLNTSTLALIEFAADAAAAMVSSLGVK